MCLSGGCSVGFVGAGVATSQPYPGVQIRLWWPVKPLL
jgi:hypothetical protein